MTVTPDKFKVHTYVHTDKSRTTQLTVISWLCRLSFWADL